MAVTLNPIDSFSEPVTRQTLHNALSTAVLGTVTASDLETGLLSVLNCTNFSDAPTTPHPGQMIYHHLDRLMYGWHDEVDGTGVSLWLAMGPDRVETAMLAAEPIPAGALVQPLVDRWVTRASNSASTSTSWLSDGVHPCVIGVCQNGVQDPVHYGDNVTYETAASGTWFRSAIVGVCYGWFSSSSFSGSSHRCDILALAPAHTQRGSLVKAVNQATNLPHHNACAYGLVIANENPTEPNGRLYPILFGGQRNYQAF